MLFTLEKAESQEFARWWVVYRNTNEDFSQSFSEQYQDVVDVPFCHWILLDGNRVGGCIRVGNNIGDFFLIPPFNDAYTALKAILPADETLIAQGILSDHVLAFQMLGFQIKESRHFMLRPTQPYSVTFNYQRTTPQATQADDIAQLMYTAFHGGVGQYGLRDVDAHRQSVDSYFEAITVDDTCHEASSILFDGEQMIAICLIQPYKSLATIRFVAVHPDYQKRGVAKRLMQYGMDKIHADYDYVALAVTLDNPAHGLYHQMGFVSGATTYVLKR